MGVKHVIY